MRNDQIDIERSIEREFIVQKSWMIVRILDFLSHIILVLIFPVLAYSFFNEECTSEGRPWVCVLIGIGSIFIAGLISYGIHLVNKLYRIAGISHEKNRYKVSQLVKQYGWKVKKDTAQICIVDLPKKMVVYTLGAATTHYL